MLFDPRWEKQTKADPFTLESLIAWLERQPANGEYRYDCNGGCLLAIYFKSMGLKDALVGSLTFGYGAWGNRTDRLLPPKFNEIAIGRGSIKPDRHTYGAALERARATLLAD